MFSHLTYKAYKNECKTVCSERCISLFGWSGSLSVITAYGLTSFDSDELLVIDILNLYGSLAIGYVCFRAKVWQAASLEVAWFCVGLYSMIKNITLDDSSNSSNPC